VTPAYPEYSSGYNAFNATVNRGLADAFQTRHLQLTLISTAVPGVPRHYDSGPALRRDVVDARVWLGIHLRFGDTASGTSGCGSPTGPSTTTSSESTSTRRAGPFVRPLR
jgi:hypothetical protein